jgi:hypothetical protein
MEVTTKETLLAKMNLMSKYRLRKLAKGLDIQQADIIKLEGDPEPDKLIQHIISKYDDGTITSEKLEKVINSVCVVTAREKKVEQPSAPVAERIEETMPKKQNDDYDVYNYDDTPPPAQEPEAPPPPTNTDDYSKIMDLIKRQNELISDVATELKEIKEFVVELSEITKFCFAKAFKLTLTKPIDGFVDILKKAKETTIAKLSGK